MDGGGVKPGRRAGSRVGKYLSTYNDTRQQKVQICYEDDPLCILFISGTILHQSSVSRLENHSNIILNPTVKCEHFQFREKYLQDELVTMQIKFKM